MRKLTAILMSLILVNSIFTGCGKTNDVSENKTQPTQTASKTEKSSTSSLDKLKKAAKDAGYVVTDDYQASFMEDVVSGFSVEIIADDQDVIYSVLECGSEDAAKKNAKTIDDAGYNIAIRNGKIISFYGVDDKAGTGKDILISILEGNPIAIK